MLNRYQAIRTKILKGSECLYREGRSAICMSNSEVHLGVTNHWTFHFLGKLIKWPLWVKIVNFLSVATWIDNQTKHIIQIEVASRLLDSTAPVVIIHTEHIVG